MRVKAVSQLRYLNMCEQYGICARWYVTGKGSAVQRVVVVASKCGRSGDVAVSIQRPALNTERYNQ